MVAPLASAVTRTCSPSFLAMTPAGRLLQLALGTLNVDCAGSDVQSDSLGYVDGAFQRGMPSSASAITKPHREFATDLLGASFCVSHQTLRGAED